MAEPNRLRDASCRNADGFRDAYRDLFALGRHRTDTRSIGERNYGISDEWSRNGSSSRGFEAREQLCEKRTGKLTTDDRR